MTLKQTKGRSPKRKGSANERRAARDLNKWLTTLEARRVPGSGALSYRMSDCQDPHFAGDIQIRQGNGHILEYIEAKTRDPDTKGGRITIAMMNGWREGRRILMARQDRGQWLCSVWAPVWDELWTHELRMMALPGTNNIVDHCGWKVRGVDIGQIECTAFDAGGAYVFWGGAMYMTVKQLCELLELAYGEGELDTMLAEDRQPTSALLRAGKRYKELTDEQATQDLR